MKLTNTILVLALACGTGWAQNGPVIIQGAKATADAAQQKQNANVKAVSAVSTQSVKPAAVAKPAAAQASKTAATKPSVVPVSSASAAKPVAQPVKAAASQSAAKPSASTASATKSTSTTTQPKAVAATAKPVAVKPVVVKTVSAAPATKAPAKETAKAAASKPATKDASADNVSVEKAPEPAKNDKNKTYSANGRRDPFISPVVNQSAVGSGCSVGKRCLAVDQISLKGVVKSETGMIAVVVNSYDKAYFLRENDPVFDGYVMKITGDSIVFKETVQDKLGKPFTKEVTKKLTTPAV